MSGNIASSAGGGVFSSGSSTTLTNCIFWDNSDDGGTDESAQIHSIGAGPVVNYTLIQSWTGALGGSGNIDGDPFFIDVDGADAEIGTTDDDLRLTLGSPAIDAADPGIEYDPGVTDLDGQARVLCDRADMGAYESGIGDFNCDGTVDAIDFGRWVECVTGPGNGPYAEGCAVFDFDSDSDVDLEDYREFTFVLDQW